jgi:hypothetical protein
MQKDIEKIFFLSRRLVRIPALNRLYRAHFAAKIRNKVAHLALGTAT